MGRFLEESRNEIPSFPINSGATVDIKWSIGNDWFVINSVMIDAPFLVEKNPFVSHKYPRPLEF